MDGMHLLHRARFFDWDCDGDFRSFAQDRHVDRSLIALLAQLSAQIGDGPIVMMSEKAGGRHRGVRVGEKIGEFKLVSVNKNDLVLGFEDRTVKKSLEELIDRGGGVSRI